MSNCLVGRLPGAALSVVILTAAALPATASSLRFYGNGVAAPDLDRVKIEIDDVSDSDPGPPADIGAADFTIELRLKADAADNGAGAVSCGSNINWIYGNILLDRDRYNQSRKFGLSIAGGRLVFGVSTTLADQTVCGSTDVLDNAWHHVAITRNVATGDLAIWVDGILDGSSGGPPGDISYPDDGIPCANCCGGGDCDFSDPFLVLGAEKHDAGASYPSYSGYLDEMRLSDVIRYAAPFAPSPAAFATDANTLALYHFDEGSGDTISDSSGHAGGPSDGVRRYGGTPAGPEWSTDTPFNDPGDLDGDGTGNAADPCTVLTSSQRFSRTKVDLKGLDLAGGSQSISWKGSFRPAAGWAVDPSIDGLHLRIADAAGALIDVDLPAGLVGASPSTPCDAGDGWQQGGSETAPTWIYRNASGFLDASCSLTAAGITQVKLKDRTSASSPAVTFQVKASSSSFAVSEPAVMLEASLGLEARTAPPAASDAAQTGACGDFRWDPISIVKPAPYCKSSASRLQCRTP